MSVQPIMTVPRKEDLMKRRSFILALSFLTLCVVAAFSAKGVEASAAFNQSETDPMVVWGNIERYSNRFIQLVDGRRFDYTKNVVIDTESLESDRRGNVRIVLDASGKATRIFFNGIDMPDVIRRFKR